jgi:uncharacterized protein
MTSGGDCGKDCAMVPPPKAKPRCRRRSAPTQAEKEGFVVRKSSIQGRGVFAVVELAKEERIVEYLGERIGDEEASRRYHDESTRRHHTFLFTVDDELCIDGSRGGNEARFINHSCEPNAYARIEERRIFLHALRPIWPGEEILFDYWYSVDAQYTDADRRRLYPCRCQAASCRGTLASPATTSKPRRAKLKE